MARKRDEEPPVEPKVFRTVGEIDQGIAKLQRRLAEVQRLLSDHAAYDSPEAETATSNIRRTVLEIFGPNSPENRDHKGFGFWHGSGIYMGDVDDSVLQRDFEKGVLHGLGILNGLISRLEEAKLDLQPAGPLVNQQASGQGDAIFIGHGRSREWLALQGFLQNRLHLRCLEYNSEPTAGYGRKERLMQLLDASRFAFLVLTAEDQQTDGSMRARENTVHEVGLFQGRLGFEKAIILLEEGCTEFSNIHGLDQIRFPKGNIEAAFEPIRAVLMRERILAGV